MTLMDFRRPKCVVLKEETSNSGKYRIFYGHHYVEGKLCYDVGSINLKTGEIVSRHYHDHSFPNPKAEALAFYEQFSQSMGRKPDATEEELEVAIADQFRRELKKSIN